MLALSLVASIVAAMNHLSPIFIAFKPTFECSGGEKDQCPGNETDFSECVYDESVMRTTVVADFNLVCSRLPLLSAVASSYRFNDCSTSDNWDTP